MDKDFLHKINIELLKKELNMDVPSIAKLAGISENGVYKWAWTKESNGTRPSYNAVVKMLLAGATTKTLFGVDSPVNKINPQSPPPEFVNDPKFQEGVKFLVEETLKAKGYR